MIQSKSLPIQTRRFVTWPCPRHLICFKQWTPEMVMEILLSALNLKRQCKNTHGQKLTTLNCAKVMTYQEVNEPILNMAVSKAASFLGAYHVTVTGNVDWDHDYNGTIFSTMTDAIFVSTNTHMCVQRFADKASVPVLCMKSRTHASIQSLATIMAIMEELGTMKCVNVSWLGPPHPVLNSYLLLCPMLGANIRFKCCCQKCPVHPLLFKASKDLVEKTKTQITECPKKDDVLKDASIVISGPECKKKDKIAEFQIKAEDISKNSKCPWRYFHTCPRGKEVDDELFYHQNSRTFVAFDNLKYIAAALMANAIANVKF